jgi:hypothetical protein
MRLRLLCVLVLLGVAFIWPAVAAATPIAQIQWSDYVNRAYDWSIRYPSQWRVNQGDLGPLPIPKTTKFSTYEASIGEKISLTVVDAEVWVTVTEASAAAAPGADFARAGYTESKTTIAGLPATRYTAAQPAFGLYDAVIVVAQGRVYRIYLSASTHAFDDLFQSMLDAFQILAAYHSDAGFSVRYPMSWKLTDGNSDVSFELPDAQGQARFSVSHADSPASVEAYLAGRLDQLASAGAIEKLEKLPSTTMLSGVSASKINYGYTRKSDGVEVKGQDLAVKAGDLLYIVRYAAPAGVYERWLDAFDQFCADFHLHSRVTLAEILAKPQAYAGQIVTLTGDFLGWRRPATVEAATAAPPVTRSDWLLGDKDQAIYIQADVTLSPDSLTPDPGTAGAAGRSLRVTAIVHQTDKGQPYLEPLSVFPQVAGAWVRRDAPSGTGLALELTQTGVALSGLARVSAAGGETASRPVVGRLSKGALSLKTSDEGTPLEIAGALDSDGRAFSGTLTSGSAAPEKLAMTQGKLALPTTGANLDEPPAIPLLALGTSLLLAGALGLYLTFSRRKG